MKLFILLDIVLLLFTACSMTENQTHSSPGRAIQINVGDNLEPYVGKKVEFTGMVSNTKYPSIGNYWVTSFELEDYRDKKVHVTGVIYKQKETTQGGFVQGRDGTYYHIRIESIKEMP